MRATWAVALAVLVVLAGAACGPVNAGSAFVEQFRPFLEERDDLVDHRVVRAGNTLPWAGEVTIRVDLRPDLEREEMVETIWSIAHHDVEDFIGYELIARFPSRSGDGGEAIASIRLNPSAPVPDDEQVRRTIADRMDRADALVALGAGPTVLDLESVPVRLFTAADGLDVVTALCADRDLLARFEDRLEVTTADVDVAAERFSGLQPGHRALVSLRGAGMCPDLRRAARVVATARELGDVVDYTVTADAELGTPPSVTVEPAEPFANVAALRDVASQERIDLTIR